MSELLVISRQFSQSATTASPAVGGKNILCPPEAATLVIGFLGTGGGTFLHHQVPIRNEPNSSKPSTHAPR